METLNMFSVLILHGLVYGMLIFLVASGLTLVFGMMDILNFAHASIYMIGAYGCYQIITWTNNFWLALLVVPIFCGIVGIFIERIFIRKIHGAGHISELLLTFGLAMVIAEVVKWIYGTLSLPVTGPSMLKTNVELWSDVTYPTYRVFIILISGLVLAFLTVILRKTRLGISVRACVQDNQMAGALGTNVSLISLTIMGIGSWLAGISGVIIAPYLSVYPNMFADMLLDCFVVIAIGGLGSLGGALIASLLIGQIQSIGVLLLPQVSLILTYLLMVLVFVLRPNGLFGTKE